MVDRAHEDELRARIEEYEASTGYQIRQELRAFRTGYDIFLGNYGDLRRALLKAQDPQVWPHLWDEDHKIKLVKFNREIARLLLNFVAAAKALVDHTRNFMEAGYTGTTFRQEYQEHVNEQFAPDTLVQFVHNLRNYMLHKSYFAASLIKIDSGGLVYNSYVALTPDKLREWDEWQNARPYVDALDAHTSLLTVIDAYREKVMRAWMWYGPRLGQVHEEDLREMARLEDRIREVDPSWVTGYGETNTMGGSDG